MEQSGFFASIAGDRKYRDSFLADWVHSFIGNGTYAGDLAVKAGGDDLAVVLPPGKAWINGRIYINDEDLRIPLSQPDGQLSRYTAIVIRSDMNARTITAQAVDGQFSASPTKPNPTRDTETYDLVLAYVYVGPGAVSVRQADITDTRLDNNLCGLVTGLVDQIDTTLLGKQLEDFFVNYTELITGNYKQYIEHLNTNEASAQGKYEEFAAWLTQYRTDTVAEFSEWVETIKAILSEAAAGNLQIEIDALTARVEALEARLDNMYSERAYLGGSYLGACYLAS